MSRRPTAQDSRYHCNLNVWGDDDAPIWPALLPRRRQRMRVWDRDTPANLQAVAGLQRNGLMLAGVPWRFQGVMSTLGHVRGELLLSESDPDVACVTVEWADRQAFLDWQASPARAAQGSAFAQWLQLAPVSELFRAGHVVG